MSLPETERRCRAAMTSGQCRNSDINMALMMGGQNMHATRDGGLNENVRMDCLFKFPPSSYRTYALSLSSLLAPILSSLHPERYTICGSSGIAAILSFSLPHASNWQHRTRTSDGMHLPPLSSVQTHVMYMRCAATGLYIGPGC